MLQIRNETPFAGTAFVSPDPEGVDCLYTVVKATFDLTPGGLAVAAEPVPIMAAAVHHGDPATSSVRVPSDISLVKPGTDVVLTGSAHAPRGREVRWMDVRLSVGPVHKHIRVFGDRVWQAGGLGWRASDPVPFTAMPLVWERAYGGVDATGVGACGELRNPVGIGFRAADSRLPLDGLPLPNLEDPEFPVTSWRDRPAPACFAPTCAHWEPRRCFAGTYDEEWQRTRAPYLPADFDARFFQVAAPGLSTSDPLRGGEPVEIRGVSPDGVLGFSLPCFQLDIVYRVDGVAEARPARLDTVIIEPDAARLVVVWKSAFRCDKRLLRIATVTPRFIGNAA